MILKVAIDILVIAATEVITTCITVFGLGVVSVIRVAKNLKYYFFKR